MGRKRERYPTIGSDVERKKILKLYQESYEGVKLKLKVINDKLRSGEDIDAESTRFLKVSDAIIGALENKINKYQKEEKEEVAADMALLHNEFVERLYTQTEVYKKEFGVKMNKRLYEEFYIDNGYVRCPYCNELHPKDDSCPWVELAKKHGIEVNDNFTKILNAPVDQEEEEIIDS